MRYLLAVIAVVLLTACGESQEVEDNTDTASLTEQVEQEQERRSAPEEPTSVPTSAPVQESTAEPTLEPTAAPEPTPPEEPTSVPTSAPVQESTAEPTLEPTAAPEPTPLGVDLETTTEAPLLVSLTPGEFGFLQVKANPAFDLGEFELTLLVDGTEYCNSNHMYGDEGYYEMRCELEERGHESVERVSAQTSKGDLRCRKNAQSTNEQTIFACDWRTAQESTVAPAPSTTGVHLETTMEAPLLVSLTPGEFGFLQVKADPAFDLGEFELTLLVDGTEYCNSNRMYGDEGYYEMRCELEERGHESVERVSAQTSKGDLRCRKNAQSTNEQTIFACDWR